VTDNNSRCNYCGRILYKQVSEKYFVCSQKCKTLIKNITYIDTVDSIVLSISSNKWNTVDELYKKVEVNKFDFISSVRRLIYFKGLLVAKEKKEIKQKSLISKVKR
tara:strand:- start:6 stop:323 length:318 start_codon:yes stop_codon:yes gene_type:complete